MKIWLMVLSIMMFSSASVIFAKQEETSTSPRVVKSQKGVTTGTLPNLRKNAKVTAQVRNELMKDKTLSASAKNLNIEVTDSNITLTGEVKTNAEKQKVLSLTARTAPKLKVFDDIILEVLRNKCLFTVSQ
jgi:osmotically-inducible protein OsmY